MTEERGRDGRDPVSIWHCTRLLIALTAFSFNFHVSFILSQDMGTRRIFNEVSGWRRREYSVKTFVA
jgi:hypothetical protein